MGTSLVHECLTLIGYWRSTEEPEWPDPRNFVDNAWDDTERDIVASYLETGSVPWVQMGYSECRFCGRENGYAELTGGTYLWPEGLSHYVREHGVPTASQNRKSHSGTRSADHS
jgi:hypothetical protein